MYAARRATDSATTVAAFETMAASSVITCEVTPGMLRLPSAAKIVAYVTATDGRFVLEVVDDTTDTLVAFALVQPRDTEAFLAYWLLVDQLALLGELATTTADWLRTNGFKTVAGIATGAFAARVARIPGIVADDSGVYRLSL